MHPIVEHLDKLEKRRLYWLDQLVSTRKSKTNLQLKMGMVQKTSELSKNLDIIREAIDAAREKQLEEIVFDDE